MQYLSSFKRSIISFKNLTLKGGIFIIFATLSLVSNAQLIFSEPFNESNGSIAGIDNVGGVNWSTLCPTCLDANDFYKVVSGKLVAQDSNGPATWQTNAIDISATAFFNISLVLQEEGNMEGCGSGCTSVDWVQLEYNIDNTGWLTPNNSVFCSGGCANINIIQSDDITGSSLNYSTNCIESGTSLQIRISVQAWAASERWIIDNVEVSSAVGPTINAGLDQTICGNSNLTLTATNPQNGILSWNNSIIDGVAFTPPIGNNTYVASSDLNGCIATDTVLINVNSQPTFTISGTNPTTCNGTDGFITLSGLNATTNYDISYDNGTGIVPPNTLTSDVNGNIVIPNLSADNYSNFLVDLLGCSTLDNSPINLTNPLAPIISAGNTQIICLGENVTLTAINPDNAILSWTNGVNDNIAFTPGLGTINYTVTANLNGCTSTDNVNVITNPIPQVNTNNDITVCEGENVTLTAININSSIITWNNGVQDGVAFIPNVGTTTYTVTANLNGCTASSQMDVIVNPNPNFIVSPSNPTSCLGSEGFITLSGLNSATNFNVFYSNGSNQGPFNMTSSLTGEIILSGLSSGNYTNFVVDNLVCINQNNDLINLTDPLPPVISTGLNQNICIGDNVTLTVINPSGASIVWNNGILDGVAFQPLFDTSYIATATLNNCTNSDTVFISVFPAPIINAGPDQSICYGDSVLLCAINTNGSNIVWDHNVIDSLKFSPESTHNYTVTTTIGTCVASDELQIIVNPLPDATFNFNPINPTVENTEVSFNNLNSNPTVETYNWNLENSQTSNLESPIHVFPEIGGISYTVSLLVTDTTGCKDSSSVQITIDDILLYYVPNAFTPDGNNINNIFQPVFTSGFDPQNYHLMIFNRWGETVFESYNSEIGWDGLYKNNELAEDGVYIWSITFGELVSDKRYNVKGLVTLIK